MKTSQTLKEHTAFVRVNLTHHGIRVVLLFVDQRPEDIGDHTLCITAANVTIRTALHAKWVCMWYKRCKICCSEWWQLT